jgi:hypothetical protein
MSSKGVLVCRTHDEVNADLARSWCDENGFFFELATQRDPVFPDGARALVIDVNHLGLDFSQRSKYLNRLCHVLPQYPAAVASYELESEVRDLLQASGWLVFRFIQKRLFYELATVINCDSSDLAV